LTGHVVVHAVAIPDDCWYFPAINVIDISCVVRSTNPARFGQAALTGVGFAMGKALHVVTNCA